MRVLISEFRQETNSFNPALSGMETWSQNGIYEGQAVRDRFAGTQCAVGGMIDAVDEHARELGHHEVTFAVVMAAQSGGITEQTVMDHYLQRLIPAIEAAGPLDVVLLSFHGALQTTDYDDPEAEIARQVRELVGENCVISVSTDLHAFISRELIASVDYVSGYQTYPHIDHYGTGHRAAHLGLKAAAGQARPTMAWVPVPMIVSAASYNTLDGPFADLVQHAHHLVESGELIDWSIYQMQPWLDVPGGHSAVLAVADEAGQAAAQAKDLARRLYSLRHAFTTHLLSIDEAIDTAEKSTSGKPVIVVDAADSCNAGAAGDSMAVAARLLERGSSLRAATVVNDGAAARRAHELGVGATAEFTLGASRDQRAVQLRATGYVRSVHDGEFVQEGPANRGMVNKIGPTAVLRFGNLDVLVCDWMIGNGDPQLYRAFGIEPTLYDLVVVKAHTSFRAAYTPFAGEILETDTPGAAATELRRLPFERIPKSLFPWSDVESPEFPVAFSRSTPGSV